jgi:hypothetical protein
MKEVQSMKRPNTITIAAILVVVLIVISAVWPLVGGDQLLGIGGSGGPGGGTPQDPQGTNPQGTPRPGGTPLDGAPLSMGDIPQGGQFQPGQGGNPDTGTQPGESNGLMPVMRILQYVLYALIIVCGLIAFGGLWSWKRWGSVMAIVTSVIVLVLPVIALFGMVTTISLMENIAVIVIALTTCVLVLLPRSKYVETTVE